MRYLIDGYNLAYQLGLIHARTAASGLEVARRSLLIYLLEAPGVERENITVVFDAQRAPPGTPASLTYQGMHVLNAIGQQADDLIEAMLEDEKNPKELAVVSNDHRIKDATRRHHCVALGCLDFLEEIQKKARPARRSAVSQSEDGEKPAEVSPAERQLWLKWFGVEEEPK